MGLNNSNIRCCIMRIDWMLILTGDNNITGWSMCWSRWWGGKQQLLGMVKITYRRCMIISGSRWESTWMIIIITLTTNHNSNRNKIT